MAATAPPLLFTLLFISVYSSAGAGFFLEKTFMKKKVATKSRQTTSSISHVQHLLPRMLVTWSGLGSGLGLGLGTGWGQG